MSGDHVHLQGRRFFEAGGDLFFIVKAIDDRIPQNLLPQFAKDLANLPIFWRHQTPQKEGFQHQPSFGKVVAAKEYPGGVMAVGRLYGSSEMPEIHVRRRALINLIKKHGQFGVALGVDELKIGASSTYDSIGVKTNKNNEVRVVEVHPFELSVTPWPACDTCVIKMSEQPKETVENDAATKLVEDALKNATIEELTELLNRKTLELEEAREKISKLEDKSAEVEPISKKNTELEDKVKTLTDKVDKLVTELETEKAAKAEAEAKASQIARDAERAPFITQLKENDKLGLFDDTMIEKMDIDTIKAKTEKLVSQNETTSKIVVTSMQKSAEENQAKDEPASPREAILKKMESCEKGTAIYKHYEEQLAKLKE
jgi:hypothetical protein